MTNPWPGPSTEPQTWTLCWQAFVHPHPTTHPPFSQRQVMPDAPALSVVEEAQPGPNQVLFVPARCPSSATFDLPALLRRATRAEGDLLALDMAQAPATRPSTPPTGCSSGASATNSGGRVPKPGRRPPGMDYQHWLRKVKADACYRAEGHKPRRKTVMALLPKAVKDAERTALDCLELPATNGAYGARVAQENARRRPYSLEEVKEMGVRVFEWNGSTPVPFLDKDGRVFAVLAGRPDDPGYLRACQGVYDLMERERRGAPFAPGQTSHRRGDYPVLNAGVTHGMGTLRPTFLDNGACAAAVDRLLADAGLQRIAAYASSAFALWAPRTYAYYQERLDALFARTGLRKIFPRSIFPTCALNFGPNACTCKHNDGKNSPFGWCSVTPLGRFNHKAGRHLILWELGVAIEFPAGSTILIPSATVSHSNTALVDGDSRASFTQYCSGGLFRWVDYDFQTEKDLKKNNPALYREVMYRRPEQWRVGVELWSTLAELMEQDGVDPQGPSLP